MIISPVCWFAPISHNATKGSWYLSHTFLATSFRIDSVCAHPYSETLLNNETTRFTESSCKTFSLETAANERDWLLVKRQLIMRVSTVFSDDLEFSRVFFRLAYSVKRSNLFKRVLVIRDLSIFFSCSTHRCTQALALYCLPQLMNTGWIHRQWFN